jgi:hypothetical protein
MLTVQPETKEQLKKALAWAVDNDCVEVLANKLVYLANYGADKQMRCLLHPDVPSDNERNFFFTIARPEYDHDKPPGERITWHSVLHGGLIYHHRSSDKEHPHTWGVHT